MKPLPLSASNSQDVVFSCEKSLVRLEGETSNTLFEELAAWEAQLKHIELPSLEMEP